DTKVVVVGAGFAGLAAAVTLIRAGFQNVKILEAKEQVGGRVCTTKPFTENIIELGANWIHGQDGNPLYQLAKEQDLLVETIAARKIMCLPHAVTPHDYFFMEGGKQLSTDCVDPVCTLFSKLTSKAFESELEDKHRALSLGDYLDMSFAESPLATTEDGTKIFEWCKRSECTDEAASSLYEVSASQIGYYIALEGGFFNSLGPGGYQAILDILLKTLPSGTILNNTAVKSIQWDLKAISQWDKDEKQNHVVQVICENDQIFDADHVIVTVSLGVLKQQARTMFEPALPKSKLDAIERLGFGTVDKIFLCFSERFWPEDCAGIQLVWDKGPEDKAVYSSQDEEDAWKETWFKKICGFDTVARHPTVLCGWITGREALYMETLQDSEVGDTCVSLLRSFTGWSVPDVSQVLISRWGHDPHVLGSYTFVPHWVNSLKEHEALAAPLPSCSQVTESKVGCELEEKERFWSELDEVMESIPTGERVVIGADFNGHVGEGNTGDEEVMGKFGVKERNLEGQMVVDFAKRMDMGVVNTYFQKREEHRVTYKSGGRRTQVDYILCRRGNLKEISDCKVVVGESVARQHRMVVCRMTLMVCKTKRSKIEKKTKWWKLKKEECCEEFRQKLRQALGGQVVLPDDWETTAEVIRETGRKVLGVSSGRRKEDKETWWWNEEVQDSIQRKRLAKKKWDMDRTEENRQEYKELQCRVKREVSKAKQKAYEELYTRLDTREGEKDLYRLARQRDRDGKDVQQKVDKIRKDEVRKALKRMKSGKAVGPDDIPVEVWKCLGEAAVEFLASLFNRVLENLEKAYDRVPREELWYCMRKSGVAEKYVRVVKDMYERSRTVVRCVVVMDQLSEEVRQESPWTMMFADDIVICSESREQVEENLERWRFALERRGMKVSRIQSNGECGKEKISVRIKGKVYRTVVRPAMLYGLETVSLRKRQESELESKSALSVMSEETKVVVVGAGFAGLAAAATLIRAGFQKVKILEAKERVGGRVCTTKPFTQNIIELGANWIHGQKGNDLYKLAKEHNLLAEKALRDTSESSQDYFFKEGGKHLPDELADGVTSLFEKLTSKTFDTELPHSYQDLTLGDYLDVSFAESPLADEEDGSRIFEWCKRNECTDEAVSSLYEVSASQDSKYIALDGEFLNCLGPGGYQAILDLLLNGLPSGTILNNTAVKSIQWDKDEEEDHAVQVICENDQIFDADHVIVTVSLGVLKQQARTMFEPALPKSKLDAIERLGFGTVDKIFLCFSERFWPEDCAGIQLTWDEGPEDKAVYSSQEQEDTWKETWFKKISGFDAVARHPTVLCGWITGREALHMETLQDSEVGDTCVRLLRSFTGWSVPDVSQVLITKWGHDPHVLGSYTFVPHWVNGVKEPEALAAPLPSCSEVTESKFSVIIMSKDAKVVVVGAGFAGLAAAATLIRAGFQNVKILEAKERVGGRVCTTKPFTQNIIELGANWIHGQKGNDLYKLAKKHNLLAEKALRDTSERSQDYFFKEGGKHLPDELADGVTSLFEKLTSKAFDTVLAHRYRHLTLGDYLDVSFAESTLANAEDGSRIFEWCKRNECTDEAVSSLYEVSASQDSEYIALDGEFLNCLGPGGYQAILDLLLNGLPSGTILNNTAVKSIQWDKDEEEDHAVQVICENDQIFDADHVIVTVSLGVLKQQARTMFEPALPKSKLDAIERLGFGTVDKIFLCFSERFWPEDCAGIQLTWDEGPEDKAVYSSQEQEDTWKETWFKKISGFDAVARHPTVLCGWITGREALHMETLQDSEVGDTCVRLLRSFTGWHVPDVSQVLITKWGHDSNVYGSYTFIPKGVNGTSKQKALAAPLPPQTKASDIKPLQVLFAGEATHENFYTTTHGAYMSGVREAQRLIKHYSH
ncbi:hypothetical protein QTP86_021570, partial [Hemibagrus guttatus]